MKKININIIKIALFLSVIFLLTSCMMLSPNHLLGMNHTQKQSNLADNYSDPVCGKILYDSEKAYTYQYHDKIYFFDSEDCINKFKQSPESYVNITAITTKNNQLVYWSLGAISMGIMMLFMLN